MLHLRKVGIEPQNFSSNKLSGQLKNIWMKTKITCQQQDNRLSHEKDVGFTTIEPSAMTTLHIWSPTPGPQR
jgi:hypothetical protein